MTSFTVKKHAGHLANVLLKKSVSDSGPEISNAAPPMFTLNLFSLCWTLLLLVIYVVCYLKVLLVAKIVERQWWMNGYGALVKWYWQRETQLLGESSVSLPLYPCKSHVDWCEIESWPLQR